MYYMFIEISMLVYYIVCFFFNDTATTEIYTLSLHDALPISRQQDLDAVVRLRPRAPRRPRRADLLVVDRRPPRLDRKSTRLNSSHANISYAVFCLKKKKITSHSVSMCVYSCVLVAICTSACC